MIVPSPIQQSEFQRQQELKPYRAVAQNMEAEFIKFLLQEMEKTVIKEEEDSGETSFYKSLLSNEYAQLMATKDGGLGLQQLILPQIVPQHLKAQGLKAYHQEALPKGQIK